MRWRYQEQDGHKVRIDGKLQRESNTRLVQWDDGTWTLHVGAEAFEVDSFETAQKGFAGLNGYLYLSQTASKTDTHEPVGTVLECIGPMTSRFTIKPSSLQSEAHKSLTVAVRQKTIKKARIAEFVTQEDPEKLKQARIKNKTDLDRATSKKRTATGRARPRMNRSYLEEEEEDKDYDTTNIKALKRGMREMDDYGDDEEEEEEEEEGGGGLFNKKARQKEASSSSDDEELVMDDDDDEDEEIARKKKAATKKPSQAVFDDDEDSD
jgi:RNA polymerase-associated protein LEO1